MTDKEKLKKIKKLADAMYYNAQYLTTDASRLRKAMDEYHKFIIHECKEEPVNKDFEMALAEMIDKAQKCVVEPLVVAAQWKDELIKLAKSEEPVSEIDFEQELYKAFGQIKDFTLGVAIAKRFYDMGRKHNEPVSEELEEAVDCYKDMVTPEDVDDYEHAYFYETYTEYQIADAFKAGAKWHKEQFEKNRLAHCDELTAEQAQIESDFVIEHLKENNRTPTFIDAIEYGMKVQKEQIIANATEVTVHIDAGGYPYIPQIELYDYDKDIPLAKEGDKYKVILIKEE